MKPQNLSILGATGSIGRSTLDVVRRHPEAFTLHALTAHQDVAGLVELALQHRPNKAVIADVQRYGDLKAALSGSGVDVLAGAEALCEVAASAETVMSAIVGAAGLLPTLSAIEAGRRVLIANKEPLVMAGALMMQAAKSSGATILPIDSEHNAIFQCLPAHYRCGEVPKGIHKIILTASGGPFRTLPLAQFASITPEMAVKHPNWRMGRKISVDSATMMNKGLELIEASVLYGLPSAQIAVWLHPESVIHSLVEYVDGTLLAQLGAPDMRIPIAHALAYPERMASGVADISLLDIGKLHFEAVQPERFPALDLARQALEAGGSAPCVLNAANEVAVEAFLNGQIRFTQIAEHVAVALAQPVSTAAIDLESILAVDAETRVFVADLVA
jgi:1-deoxy-D-xylulose-5-phosphate reductoisomerase